MTLQQTSPPATKIIYFSGFNESVTRGRTTDGPTVIQRCEDASKNNMDRLLIVHNQTQLYVDCFRHCSLPFSFSTAQNILFSVFSEYLPPGEFDKFQPVKPISKNTRTDSHEKLERLKLSLLILLCLICLRFTHKFQIRNKRLEENLKKTFHEY